MCSFSSVTQPCPTLCDPMNRSTPGFPVPHQLPESTQTHVHRVGDTIQPSHPLSSPSPPAFNPSQHQGLFKCAWTNLKSSPSFLVCRNIVFYETGPWCLKVWGWRSLEGCSPWGRWVSDTTERLPFHFSLSCIGEGNGNPLQCSCLENPRDGGAWWATVYGVTQSQTRLKRLSSSSSSYREPISVVSGVYLWTNKQIDAYFLIASYLLHRRQNTKHVLDSPIHCQKIR